MGRKRTDIEKYRVKEDDEKKTPRAGARVPYKLPERSIVECPACGESVVFERRRAGEPRCVPCDLQPRLVVFEGVDFSKVLPPPEEVLAAIEIGTGRVVFGRAANEAERDYYREHKTLDGFVPWAMGRASHFETCKRWDRWLSGEAKLPGGKVFLNDSMVNSGRG